MTTPVPAPRPVRFLALGDSYTIGESVPEGERWPIQLSGMLAEKGFAADVTIIARTGWTTAELWQGIQDNPPSGTYDLVSLLVGVNNQYRGYDQTEYREQFRFLLSRSIEYAAGKSNHVAVLSIPDWGVTPYAAGRDRAGIADEIDAYNSINREETLSIGANYLDITPASREAVDDPSLIAVDGLHPSGKMYAAWAGQTLPIALDILNKK